jgi:hypothetical protein
MVMIIIDRGLERDDDDDHRHADPPWRPQIS